MRTCSDRLRGGFIGNQAGGGIEAALLKLTESDARLQEAIVRIIACDAVDDLPQLLDSRYRSVS